jgi:hypothetical protein|tara:strand:+ start:87 stop:452 length:366 start_codon:yes stop_codon:yes gene_type:complete
MNTYYFIRDTIIPNMNIDYFKNYLIHNEEYLINNINNIETFYGTAISYSDNQIISLLNLFVREYDIKINKMNVLQEIYYSDYRKKYSEEKEKNEMLLSDPIDFNNKEIQDKYIFQYYNIFE